MNTTSAPQFSRQQWQYIRDELYTAAMCRADAQPKYSDALFEVSRIANSEVARLGIEEAATRKGAQ